MNLKNKLITFLLQEGTVNFNSVCNWVSSVWEWLLTHDRLGSKGLRQSCFSGLPFITLAPYLISPASPNPVAVLGRHPMASPKCCSLDYNWAAPSPVASPSLSFSPWPPHVFKTIFTWETATPSSAASTRCNRGLLWTTVVCVLTPGISFSEDLVSVMLVSS